MAASANLKDDIKTVYISKRKLASTVKRLAKQINRDYAGKNLMLICVLKGSVVFLADLMRQLTLPCSVEFMVASSYDDGTEHGTLQIKYDLRPELNVGKYDILIVEDILDSGNTLYNLKQNILERGPKSFKICTLLDKPERREADIKADYVGLTICNEFVVGYGLDYNEKYRNLPFIGIPKDSAIEKDSATE